MLNTFAHSLYMLNKMASLLFSLTAAILLIVPATSQPPGPQFPPEYWKLALHWPNSFCRDTGVHCSSSIPQNAFVIRSLLGMSRFGEEVPCKGDHPPLDRSSIAELENLLSQYWPDLEGDNFRLWQKEWQDRASCYSNDAHFYFLNAIGLKIDIDREIVKGFGGVSFPGEQVFGALSREGVTPGNVYPFTIFGEKMLSRYGKNLEVVCDEDSEQVSQLLEITMCANASIHKFHLIPCPAQTTGPCWKDVRYT